MKNQDTFTERLEAQAKARLALLEKAKQNDPTNDPEFAARQQARLEAARQRDEREAEQRRTKAAERDKQKVERAAKAAAKIEAERLAAEETKRRAEEARLAAELAAKESARHKNKVRPAALGLQDLKAAMESRGK